MLPRVLEPEVMDSDEEARDYDRMDHAAVNARFVADLLAEGPLDASRQGPVLDLGTGTAQIPIELCRADPAAKCVAVDLAESMLALARKNVAAAGFADRIEVKRADGKRLPFADDAFFAVMSNSIVHHIPNPADTFAEALRVTRREGRLFFRDLLRPESDAEVERLVALHAAGANDRQRFLFDASLRAALTLDEVRAIVDALGLCPNCVVQTSDRHWTFAAAVK
jgi:ubiquinone/menaquinone biosynthesis C-methylase UbiE